MYILESVNQKSNKIEVSFSMYGDPSEETNCEQVFFGSDALEFPKSTSATEIAAACHQRIQEIYEHSYDTWKLQMQFPFALQEAQ